VLNEDFDEVFGNRMLRHNISRLPQSSQLRCAESRLDEWRLA
jgi:hypothetical protein